MFNREILEDMAAAAYSALELGDLEVYNALLTPIRTGEFIND